MCNKYLIILTPLGITMYLNLVSKWKFKVEDFALFVHIKQTLEVEISLVGCLIVLYFKGEKLARN